jgi:hypothetical protein
MLLSTCTSHSIVDHYGHRYGQADMYCRPGHESYETIMKTLTRGDPDKAQAQFSMALYRISACGHQTEKVLDNAIHVKEQFWVHAYNDLVAFITDFRRTEVADLPRPCRRRPKPSIFSAQPMRRESGGAAHLLSTGSTI